MTVFLHLGLESFLQGQKVLFQRHVRRHALHEGAPQRVLAQQARLRKFHLNKTMEKLRTSKKWDSIDVDSMLTPASSSMRKAGGKKRRKNKGMRGSVSLPNVHNGSNAYAP